MGPGSEATPMFCRLLCLCCRAWPRSARCAVLPGLTSPFLSHPTHPLTHSPAHLPSRLAAIAFLFLATRSLLASTNLSVWAYPGPTGRLLYKADYLGNRVLDTSGVGYKGGLVPLPTSNTVPARVTISPVGG